MADAVVQTDPIEQHGGGLSGEPAGEDLAVVRKDLLGHPVARQALDECVTHGPRGRPNDQLGDHAEPRVVIDPGDDLALRAVSEHHPAHHVHLPKLHGPGALPAAVVLLPSSARLGIDQAVAHQAAVDRGAGGRLLQLPSQLRKDGARTPAGMGFPQGDDPRLDLRSDLVRAPIGARAAVGEGAETFVRVAEQPAVDGPPVDPVAGGDVGDPRS